MENGVVVVQGSHLEGKLMENEALYSTVVDNNNTKFDGSEEDEVFEEAVGAEIPLDHVVTNGGDDTVNGDPAKIDDKTAPRNDFDKFEETIGVPLSVDIEQEELPVSVPVHAEDSLETPVPTDLELDGGHRPKGESGETEKVVHMSPDEQVGREISDVNPTGEVGSPVDGSETEQNSEAVAQVGENGVQESVSLPEVLVQENADVGITTEETVKEDEEPEAENSVIVSGGDSDSVPAKSPGENLSQDENGEEGKEIFALSDTDHKDREILVKEDLVALQADEEPEAANPVIVSGGESDSVLTNSPGENLYQDVNGEEGKQSLGLSDNDYKDSEILAKEDLVVSDSHTDGEPEVNDRSDSIDLLHEDDQSKDLKEEISSSPVHLDANDMKELKVSVNLGLEQDDGELDRAAVSTDSNHLGANGESEKKTHPTAEEPEVTQEADIVPTSDDSGVVKVHEETEKLPISEDTTTVEIVEKMDDLPTPSDSPLVDTGKTIAAADPDVGVGGNVEGSQHEFVDKDVEASTVEIKEPETKGVIHEEVRQNVQGTREAEIKPAAVFLPSRKPADQTPTPARPAGLGSAAPLLEPSRAVQQPRVNGTSSHTQQAQLVEDPSNGEAEENDETREKLQMIRVKFLRLAHRLGQTPHNVVVAQVLYRLGLAEQLRGRNGGRVGAFSFDRASAMAEHLEAAGQEPLDFSCTIMVLGKSGVGKSATINSIFDEAMFGTDAFQLGTKKVQDVVGTVQGIKVRVIDTPGLLPSWSDQRQNEKILLSVKRFIKKTPPDIVLYLDRLDMQSRDSGDMPLLRTITDVFGPSIWFNAIVVLTHAASAPPEGPNGTATSYDMFVTQRSHVVQQAIRQAAGDMRLMNPVSLVENHSACRTNRAGQRVLPNGQVWKPHLLLLSFASKILAEANTLLKLQDSPPGRPFATRTRAPPLPFLLSSLLQSRPLLKLPEEQFGDDDTLDDDLDESSDSDDESAYDDLPPFKRLSKAQLGKLTKAQKRAYHDELEYREKLFMKKQLKEEKRRRRFMKKMAESAKDLPSDYSENVEEESGGAASVPVPMPDLALPASFDSDNPTHRYRYLDSPNQWVVRPVLDTHGWDHDIGYEGVNVEKVFVIKQEIPVSFSGQVTKDKKDSNLQMEISSSLKHGKDKATSLGLDMQTLGKDMVYTLRSETRFCNYRQNKATAGLSVTLLGDALTGGVKIEDKLIVNKRFRMVVSGGAMAGRGDVAYGGSLEATLRDKDHPLGRSLTTLGLSVMDWHGDLAIGGNLQSQIPIGRSTNLIARANLNNRSSGQLSIRLNSSEQLQIALVALLPLLRKLYPQQWQFGQW